MKRSIFILFLLCISYIASCQVTTFEDDWWDSSNTECMVRLCSVEVRDDGVVVTIELKAKKALRWLGIFHTSNTYIVSKDNALLQLTGLLENNKIVEYGGIENTKGWHNVGVGETRRYSLFFRGHLPAWATSFTLKDYGNLYGSHGYGFSNYKINITRKNYLSYSSESAIKQYIDQNNDGICGIYEPFGFSGATVACVKNNGEYCLIYVSGNDKIWQIGDIKANLQRTASNILKAEWYDRDKDKTAKYVGFDGVSMLVTNNSSKSRYLKIYPLETPSVGGGSSDGEWTGTGFALRDGYVVTNNHVVKGASSISVVGVNGSSTEMKARVVAVDSKNDLALIKINDSKFYGFGSIPYSVKNMVADVGADVFVLGYPLTQYMGEEIKLTNGIISSRSGYQGDVTTYQISAPVQPGNSGGPMFDKNGNIIGIVNAGIPNAENVGYAIKTSYLFNLINSQVSSSVVPNNNTLSGMSLSDKVKAIRNYVFQIKCH